MVVVVGANVVLVVEVEEVVVVVVGGEATVTVVIDGAESVVAVVVSICVVPMVPTTLTLYWPPAGGYATLKTKGALPAAGTGNGPT